MHRFYPEMSPTLGQRLRSLAGQRVAVFGHVRPDGDCIGSQVALVRILEQLGARAVAVNEHPVPSFCRAFVGDTAFLQADAYDWSAELYATVDCADKKRLGGSFNARALPVELNIDHHVSNSLYGEHDFISAESSATAELLAGVCFDEGIEVDAVTAQALYVGIATDTQQFTTGSTTPHTFDVCRALIARGADPAAAALELYGKESRAKLALLQRFLASLRYECDGRVCLGLLRDVDFRETGAQKEDTEGIVDYARGIEGVEIGVLVEEHGASVKGSFRAKDPVHQVNELAKQFNGGGHPCAAGFNPEMSVEELLPKLLAVLEAHFAAQATL